MTVGTETERLRRAVDAFVAGVNADLGNKAGLSPSERNQLRAEIESCAQRLDELHARLNSG